MQLKKGQIVELDIHAMAFGGAGIGKYEGMTVFVNKTMPGDRVRASFTRIKPKYAEAEFESLVLPSRDRCEQKCKYSGICGGCQFQFMPYESQLAFKKQHVIDAFERIGKIYSPPVLDVIGCEKQFYYRNKMEFSFISGALWSKVNLPAGTIILSPFFLTTPTAQAGKTFSSIA